jgi:hypothetical protein
MDYVENVKPEMVTLMLMVNQVIAFNIGAYLD